MKKKIRRTYDAVIRVPSGREKKARMRVFKVLNSGGRAPYVSSFIWPLPKNGKPGEWVDVGKGRLVACEHGLHLTVKPLRIEGTHFYLAEYEVHGEDVIHRGFLGNLGEKRGTKIVVRRARLLRRVTKAEAKKISGYDH